MLRAGTMARYRGVSVTYTETRSTVTGAKKKTETIGKTFHFNRLTIKEQRALLGREEAVTGLIILECWQSPTTRGMTHFRYGGELYRVEQRLDDAEAHRYEITGRKVNE